jgi:peptide chain release factor 3
MGVGATMTSLTTEVAKRRTFAIISHPDAGKTTLTEKLLLYAGAIEEAGAVKARAGRQRDVTSDWMELERARGISITSTVLQFDYGGHVFNLLDTPGHRDFSEDTYRVLSAVDSAVIVLDAAKGIEEQTLKLFEVARRRSIPLLTFVNKCDRPSLAPLEIIDDIEARLGLRPTPVTWPVGADSGFVGVVDRRDSTVWRFDRTPHGALSGDEHRSRSDDLASAFGPSGRAAADELELLDGVGAHHDQQAFLSGATSPVFFGSALWNFGVRLLLESLIALAPSPGPRRDAAGALQPLDGQCSGSVFKVQANLDPRHRDRVAYVRVCSGRFERGMTLINQRTGRSLSTKYASQMFGQERSSIDGAVPGDVVGLVNAGGLKIGDTLSEDGTVAYPPIPTFAPEHFMLARNLDTGRYKQFRRGVSQLEEEGVIQVLRHPERGDGQPVLAAVGPMQYDVTRYRLEAEYGARIELTPTDYSIARRTDPAGAERLTAVRGVDVFTRSDGVQLALFRSRHQLAAVVRDYPDLTLDAILVA